MRRREDQYAKRENAIESDFNDLQNTIERLKKQIESERDLFHSQLQELSALNEDRKADEEALRNKFAKLEVGSYLFLLLFISTFLFRLLTQMLYLN